MGVDYSIKNEIAVVVVDNPPVNALSQSVRAGTVAAIGAADHDPTVRGIVLRCAGRTFIAGADIREFDRPPEPPFLPEVTHQIENSPKPVVAAIHGTALGGGFEIALACHYRLATPDAKVGLPEVKLGILPASGGTQRLPRLIGIERSIAVITEGSPISATVARDWGAIDEVAEADGATLEEQAITAARRLSASSAPLRRVGTLPVPEWDRGIFERAAEEIDRKHPGFMAPRVCLEAIRAAADLPFHEGLQRERELFLTLRASDQATALRYVFFAEREVARPPGLERKTTTRPIARAAVIGAGTMGVGIAMSFANAGIPVTLLESSADALDKGVATIRRNYASAVARGRMSQEDMDARLRLVDPTIAYDDLGEADCVVEAVFEDLGVKQQVFRQLDAIAKPGAILATNTSYLDVSTIASFTRRPQDVVGTHFFSPANVMRLLEVVKTPMTAPEVLKTALALGRRLGKVAVLVGGADGFVGNRMLAQRTREAYFLLEEGALPQQVDRVLADFGFPMGPFAVGDLAGLDVGWRNRKARAHRRVAGVRDSTLLDKVCELGRFGQKTGSGWYRYEKGSRAPLTDPVVERLIVEHSGEIGIPRRDIPDEEILTRCLYALINEGGRILDEGVAARETDVDLIWIHGYGFPAYRGGPLFFAKQHGYQAILQAVRELERRFGSELWRPSHWLLAKASGESAE